MRSLVIYDFDHSLIDVDSDMAVLTRFLTGDQMAQMQSLRQEMQWTDLMHHSLGLIHSQGITPGEIRQELSLMPLSPRMVDALRHVKSANLQSDIAVVSDANTVYIESLLESRGVRHLFSHIVTNPAEFDQAGRLHIRRLLGAGDPPHGCTLGTCSVNICKGQEVDKLMALGSYDRIFYIGDGQNDFCPITRLRSCDVALVRTSRSLERLMGTGKAHEDGLHFDNGAVVKSRVVYWTEAEDVLKVFSAEIS